MIHATVPTPGARFPSCVSRRKPVGAAQPRDDDVSSREQRQPTGSSGHISPPTPHPAEGRGSSRAAFVTMDLFLRHEKILKSARNLRASYLPSLSSIMLLPPWPPWIRNRKRLSRGDLDPDYKRSGICWDWKCANWLAPEAASCWGMA